MDPVNKCQKQINRRVRWLTKQLIAMLMQCNCNHATISLALENFPMTIEGSMEGLLEDCFELLREQAQERAGNPFRFDKFDN